MARPTKYSDKIPAKVRKYMESYRDFEEVIPTLAGCARYIGISRDTLNEWRKHDDKKKLSDALDILEGHQEIELTNKGLLGIFNPTIAKLQLVTKHGYSDKLDQTHANPDGTPLAFKVIHD